MIKVLPLLLLFIAFINDNCQAQEGAAAPFWQEPFEGVPDHYRKWNYPDYQFPKELGAWKKERLQVRATLQELLGDIPTRPSQPKPR